MMTALVLGLAACYAVYGIIIFIARRRSKTKTKKEDGGFPLSRNE
jgi:hypothetical protein